ncbi:MAG: hypothetical protein ACO263_09255 [Cyclobacteriaceae bacterium]
MRLMFYSFVWMLHLLGFLAAKDLLAQQVSNPESVQFVGTYYDKYFGAGPIASVPLSNRDFIDNRSLRGARFFYRELINDRVSAGFDLSYLAYDDYLPPRVFDDGTTAIFTDLYNAVEQYAVTVSGEYNFRPGQQIMPYAGLGGGASYSTFALYYNIYSDAQNKWSGLIRPYAGVFFRFSDKSTWAAFTTASFDHAFVKAPDYDYNGFSAFNLHVGLVFLDW